MTVDNKCLPLCNGCKKTSITKTGWHLDNGLNFCSNKCVIKYLESDKNYTCLLSDGKIGCSHKKQEKCSCRCHK